MTLAGSYDESANNQPSRRVILDPPQAERISATRIARAIYYEGVKSEGKTESGAA
jgi:hypothetical protein